MQIVFDEILKWCTEHKGSLDLSNPCPRLYDLIIGQADWFSRRL